MDIDSDFFISKVTEILEDKKTMSSFELEQKHFDFKEKYFKIYDLCSTAPSENDAEILNKFKLMLNVRQDVKTGKKSDIEANVQVSEYMAKLYVYPTFGEPTIEQKKAALKKIIDAEKAKKEKERSN